MRIVTMKQQATLQVINEAVLAAGTASGVWSEDSERGACNKPPVAAQKDGDMTTH